MPRCVSPLLVARVKKDALGVSSVALRVLKTTAMGLHAG
jgi:hypothetical protein